MNLKKNRLSLNKYQKIELVRMLGLNTEENILINSTDNDDIDRLAAFGHEHNLKQVSIRTMSTGESLETPHYPTVNGSEIWDIIEYVTSKGLVAIVATCIDPSYARLAGAIWKKDKVYSGELAIGPHTVRRVTRDGIVDISFEYFHWNDLLTITVGRSSLSRPELGMVRTMIDECTKIPFSKCLIELSYYSIPVGWNKQNVIIWDIDSDGSEESTQEIEFYYHSQKNDLPTILNQTGDDNEIHDS